MGTNWKIENSDSVLGENKFTVRMIKSRRGCKILLFFFSLGGVQHSTGHGLESIDLFTLLSREFGLGDLWRRVLHSKLIMIL